MKSNGIDKNVDIKRASIVRIKLLRSAAVPLTLVLLMACNLLPSSAGLTNTPTTAPNQPAEAANQPNEASTQAPTTEAAAPVSKLVMASLGPDGSLGNGLSNGIAISEDSRYVAFSSTATNLVPEKTTNFYDIFVYSRESQKIVRVSVSTDGQEANSDSGAPNISADGRIVSFLSRASNLVPNDANDQQDIFFHDRDSDGNGVFDEPDGTKTELVSVSLNGGAGNNFSWGPRLSGNGRFVTFFSLSNNLVTGDTNQCGVYDNPSASSTPGMCTDVFVRDLQTGKTVLADLSSNGEQANQAPDTCELGPDISYDGRFIVFQSAATNLVPGKTNMCSNNNFMNDQGPCPDIFLHDNQTGETNRLSVGANGEEGDNESARPVIASNGRYVAFESLARNLVPGIPKNVGGWVVYVVDTQTGEIKVGSVNSKGQPVDGSDPIISDDGRFVGFHSDSYDIVSANPPEDSSRLDFYIHDFQTGLTQLVSQGTEGPAATGRVSTYDLSGGAKWAVFVANKSLTGSAMPACDNDIPGSNSSHECSEIFLRDLLGMFK